MYLLYTHAWSKISPTMTSLLSQRRQFGLNCKKIIALKIAYKIVAFFTKNYPSVKIYNIGLISKNNPTFNIEHGLFGEHLRNSLGRHLWPPEFWLGATALSLKG